MTGDEDPFRPCGAPSNAGRLVADEHATNPPPEVEALTKERPEGIAGTGALLLGTVRATL